MDYNRFIRFYPSATLKVLPNMIIGEPGEEFGHYSWNRDTYGPAPHVSVFVNDDERTYVGTFGKRSEIMHTINCYPESRVDIKGDMVMLSYDEGVENYIDYYDRSSGKLVFPEDEASL